jgi:hypothetical protein
MGSNGYDGTRDRVAAAIAAAILGLIAILIH